MKTYTGCIVILLMLLMSSYSKAQGKFAPGFIVTTQNDTLKGDVKLSKAGTLLYKPGHSVEQELAPNEVKLAVINDRYYTSEKVLDESRILQEIVSGNMSLYSSEDMQGETTFFIKKNNEIFAISPRTLKGILSYQLKDCKPEDLTSTEHNLKYSYSLKSLLKFTTFYNRCSGNESTQVIRYKKKESPYRIAIVAGPDIHQFKFGSGNKLNADKDFGKNVGLVFGIAFVNKKDKVFAFQPEIQFSHSRGNATLQGELNELTTVDTDITANFVDLPLLLHYNLPTGKIKSFINVGPQIGGAQANIDKTPKGYSYANGGKEKVGQVWLRAGFSGGIGATFPHIMKGMQTEIRYNKSYYNNESYMADLQSSSIKFTVGFFLK